MVLPRQPPDQVARLGRKRRTAGPATAASPTSLKQCPVPAAERLRTDRKAGPSLGREQLAYRSEQGPVGGRVPRPLPAAPEDRQLVAQHDDLKLPLTTTAGEHADEAAQKPVQQRHQHDAQSEPARPRSPTRPSRPESNFLYPTGGSLSIYTPNPRHLIERLKAHDLILAQNPMHIGLRTSEELARIHEECDFIVDHVGWTPSFFPVLRTTEKILGRNFQTFRYRLCVRARTPQSGIAGDARR
jgi:hypothetical protein